MLKLLVFAVHDSKAEAYMQPFFCATRGVAMRGFADEVKRADSNIGQHPADYTLFHVGDFDSERGMFTQIVPVSLGNGVEFLEPLAVAK